MKVCAVESCQARSTDNTSVKFFQFPSTGYPSRRQQWVNKIRDWNDDDSFVPNSTNFVCGLHFESGAPTRVPGDPDNVPSIEDPLGNTSVDSSTGLSPKAQSQTRKRATKPRNQIPSKDVQYDYLNTFMKNVNKLRVNDLFCDMTLKIVENNKEYEYNAHSIVVGAHSVVLQSYISQCDPNEKHLCLSDTTREEMDLLVNYFYGILPKNEKQWATLCDLADSYEVQAVPQLYNQWKVQGVTDSTQHEEVMGGEKKIMRVKKRKGKSENFDSSNKKTKLNDDTDITVPVPNVKSEDFPNINRFMCGVCSQNYESMDVLIEHIKTHNKSTSPAKKSKKIIKTVYQCGKCSAQYDSAVDLRAHLKTHPKAPPKPESNNTTVTEAGKSETVAANTTATINNGTESEGKDGLEQQLKELCEDV